MRCAKHPPHSLMRQRKLQEHLQVRRLVENLAKRNCNYCLNKQDFAKAMNMMHSARPQMLIHLVFQISPCICQVAQNYLSTPSFPLIASLKHLVLKIKASAMNYLLCIPKIYLSMSMLSQSAAITNHRAHLISSFSSCHLKPFWQRHFVSTPHFLRRHLKLASHLQPPQPPWHFCAQSDISSLAIN